MFLMTVLVYSAAYASRNAATGHATRNAANDWPENGRDDNKVFFAIIVSLIRLKTNILVDLYVKRLHLCQRATLKPQQKLHPSRIESLAKHWTVKIINQNTCDRKRCIRVSLLCLARSAELVVRTDCNNMNLLCRSTYSYVAIYQP